MFHFSNMSNFNEKSREVCPRDQSLARHIAARALVGAGDSRGGQAVLAHPGRYKVTGTGLRRLLGEFRDYGGDALEVLSPSHLAAQVAQFAALARTHGLAASTGSDYHGPGESWLDLGDLPALPAGLDPVWQDW
jgi:hypothetical protein